MKIRFCYFLPALLSMILISEANADSYRCGQKLIRSGDSTADLLRLCGAPSHIDKGYANVKVDGVHRNTRVERWHYKKSRRSLGRVVLVYRGQVRGIDIGGR
jgi:hypothetical protein